MNRPAYSFSANEVALVFEFDSISEHSLIHKRIEYTPTVVPDLYNLALGDVQKTGEIAAICSIFMASTRLMKLSLLPSIARMLPSSSDLNDNSVRTTDLKPKGLKKQIVLPKKYASWDNYVQAKVDRANERLNRIDLTKLTSRQQDS